MLKNVESFEVFFSIFSLIFNDFVDQGGTEFYRIQTPFRVFRQDECTQEREGSTGPSRGEHRLTVYRAHASIFYDTNIFEKNDSSMSEVQFWRPCRELSARKALSSRIRITHDSQSLSSSKSNTLAAGIALKHASQKNRIFDHKNEEISKSVNSFDTGSIFRPRLGHDLSRNTSVVSIYAFYGNSHVRKYFL